MEITLVQGDITEQRVDAIINAANGTLLGGGGVDGAIHRRGGPAILAECRRIRATRYPDGLPTGGAVATTAGDLPARWVIHTTGPVWWSSEKDELAELLRDCYTNTLRLADELGAASVAYPLISAGAYGWPVDDAVHQALTVLRTARPTTVTEVRLVLFGTEAYTVAERIMADS